MGRSSKTSSSRVECLEDLLTAFPKLTLENLRLIEEALQKGGAALGVAFGDYSKGLVYFANKTRLELEDHGDSFWLSMDCDDERWDFVVSIDKKTLALLNPMQGEIAAHGES